MYSENLLNITKTNCEFIIQIQEKKKNKYVPDPLSYLNSRCLSLIANEMKSPYPSFPAAL